MRGLVSERVDGCPSFTVGLRVRIRDGGEARIDSREFEAPSGAMSREFARLWTAFPPVGVRASKSARRLDPIHVTDAAKSR